MAGITSNGCRSVMESSDMKTVNSTGARRTVHGLMRTRLVLQLVCILLACLATDVAAQPDAGFDHFQTGFPLEGAHSTARCTSCHLQGIFEGTPVACAACHGQTSRMGGDKFPAGHVKVLPLCEECHTNQFWKPLARMNHDAVIGSCSSCHNGTTATGKAPNHIQSGNTCDDCHTTSAWSLATFDHAGVTPGTCFSCHNGNTATGKTPNHIQSSNTCDDCHTTSAWGLASFDHAGVTSGTCFSCHTCDDCHTTSAWVPAVFDHSGVTGSCSSCHNGTTATGKDATHIQTTSACEDCHGTTAWVPVLRVDHASVLGTCFSCHNGTTATGKTPNHIQSGNTCDDCHTTSAWVPAVFDHSSVAPGTCSTCHNGTTATGKTSNHIITTAQCDACHTTIAWLPASFDHSLVTGSCSSCHNGTTATGKPGGHFVTSLQCDECHSTNLWVPVDYRHTSPLYPGDHRVNPVCTACHQTNSEQVVWTAPAYAPDCAACHANDFKPGSHKKYVNPDTFYSVSELRDCSGSCHTYTDSSLTTLSRSRPGPEHRVTNSDF